MKNKIRTDQEIRRYNMGIDSDIYDQLADIAKQERRSINSQAVCFLEYAIKEYKLKISEAEIIVDK